MENSVTKFHDFNFKLAVIQELMYNQGILKPKFDLDEFIETYKDREINPEDHEYEVIPEVKTYFENFAIPKEMLNKVEEIYQDGGDDIYMNTVGIWDGEDDLFNITSTKDLELVPNLKKITLFYDEEGMEDKFLDLGIDTEYL